MMMMMTMMTMTMIMMTLSMLMTMTMKKTMGRKNTARKVEVRVVKMEAGGVVVKAKRRTRVKVESRKREARLMRRVKEEDLHVLHVPTKASKLPFHIHINCSRSPIDHPQWFLTYVYVYSRQTYYCKSRFSNVHI